MPKLSLDLTWDVNYLTRPVDRPKRMVLLLHGFQQTGGTILRLLGGCFDQDTLVVAPNGLFPYPYRSGNGYKIGYAWYFYDPVTGVYGVTMDPARTMLKKLVNGLGYAHLPKWVAGYSQGGYLAPFVAQDLEGVTRVIGVNSRYRHEVLTEPLPFRLDALHGALDPVVEPEGSQTSHEKVIAAGNRGSFTLVTGAAHKIGDKLRTAFEAMVH
ncbi:MAG: hypothetical protein QNK37_01240 [Acidobacteriota bacterium]|nr:hypothetical protein [Acidobacteriota bacterium]